jgi:hypothetical protein
MATASQSNAEPAASRIVTVPTSVVMDRDFIARNQVVERYLAGRLPLKGAQDFERFCHSHPELLDEIGLLERINAGLRLLDAGGKPTPWEAPARKWWEHRAVLIAAAGVSLALAIGSAVLSSKLGTRDRTVTALRAQMATQPIEAVTTTQPVRLVPSRTAPSRRAAVTVGGHNAELADIKLDLSWSQFTNYRIGIDRIDQGRVAMLYNLQRDSNGELRVALNTSAFGPGDYQLSIEGLDWRGQPVSVAWATVGIAH